MTPPSRGTFSRPTILISLKKLSIAKLAMATRIVCEIPKPDGCLVVAGRGASSEMGAVEAMVVCVR